MTAHLTRRAAVVSLVAAPAAMAAFASAAPTAAAEDDPVFAAIERHELALDAFIVESARQDGIDELTDDEEACLRRLSDAEAAALWQVADIVPTTKIGAVTGLARLCREGDAGRYGDLLAVFAESLIVAAFPERETDPERFTEA